MSKIDDLRKAAEAAMEALQAAEAELKENATAKIQKIMDDAGLSNDDLAIRFPPTPKPVEENSFSPYKNSRMKSGGSGGTRKSPAITHQDPANPENVWRSRGLKPRWLQAYLNSGRTLEEFAVPQ